MIDLNSNARPFPVSVVPEAGAAPVGKSAETRRNGTGSSALPSATVIREEEIVSTEIFCARWWPAPRR
jgi:hypothetical protein